MERFCNLVKRHTLAACLVLLGLLILSIILGIGLGPVSIRFSDVYQVMFHRLSGIFTGQNGPLPDIRESTQNIVWFLRAPRVLLGALIEGMPHQLLSGGELAGQQRRNDRALRLMRYVDENYTHKVNLSDFAQAEGLSLGYASHFARAALGQSFQDYVDTVRFYAACKQIAAGQGRLVDVYAASGFSDYRYFSRAFQKRFGMTPEEYRRRQPPAPEETHIHHSVHSLEQFYTRAQSLALLARCRTLAAQQNAEK